MANNNPLPADLIDRGFRLVRYENGRMLAVSVSYGCSFASRDLTKVIQSARNIAVWCEQQNRKRQR